MLGTLPWLAVVDRGDNSQCFQTKLRLKKQANSGLDQMDLFAGILGFGILDYLEDRKKEEEKQGFSRTEQDPKPGLFLALENWLSQQPALLSDSLAV